MLTEPTRFGGSMEDLRAVRAAVEHPVLRKDFLVDPDEILEARAAGADTVLLISSCLSDDELATMLATARDLGMEPLVETHTDEDLERVLSTDARGGRGQRARSGVAGRRRARGAAPPGAHRRRIGSASWKAGSGLARTSWPPCRPARLPSWWARP